MSRTIFVMGAKALVLCRSQKCELVVLLLAVVCGVGCASLTEGQRRNWLDQIEQRDQMQAAYDRVTWVYKAR